VGYFSFNGNLDTYITIRTALGFTPHVPHPAFGHPLPLPRARDSVQAGGGWVNDSEPEAEFQETVNKAKAMLKAVALAETFAKSP
jgi:anthranilate synthase component 1